ncbi:carboxylesterase family protein [Spongiibacter sp. KMU-166]|uniref:Carboxylic ester hydrolase n=1 Tax=Spongiibacter thalassae TaxID=2721624 RepID=A0ABX1GGD5_9GAMM|nr:carboxylesterase family protein [Spongiibacter thalassae]NKI18265.1 carboxylesterase family protein [Spongiibacter thalassae]
MDGLSYFLRSLFSALVLLAVADAIATEDSGSATASTSRDYTSVIHTAAGQLRGFSASGVEGFLGIPYAAPPVADLRWQAPRDASPWQGVLDATRFGSACAQFGNFYTSNEPETFEQPYGSEDCLYLNVWKPASAEKRPVLVFIHGGSAVHGAASLPLYDGQRLAKELDVVFVSINYRLGFLGNLHLAALHNDDPSTNSGHFALLDQIKALEWVQGSIGRFGGDTDNVTVMGHSAGCASIWSLMSSPLASGTFHKAICLSGIPLENTASQQRDTSHRLLANLLLKDKLINSAEALPDYLNVQKAGELREYLYLKTTEEITAAGQGITMTSNAVDGHVVTTEASEAVVNPVPTLMGQTLDEAPLLLLHGMANRRYSGLWELIHCDCEFEPRTLFDSRYQYARFKLSAWVVNRILLGKVDDGADMLSRYSGAPVYRYSFEWKNMPEPWRSLVGAYHGVDIPFVFGNFGIGSRNFTHFTWPLSSGEEREALHRQLMLGFKGFVESGDPSHYPAGLRWPSWAEYREMAVISGDR